MKEKIETCFTFPCGQIIVIYLEGDSFISDEGQLIDWIESIFEGDSSSYLDDCKEDILAIERSLGCYSTGSCICVDIGSKPSKKVAITCLIQYLVQVSTLIYYCA